MLQISKYMSITMQNNNNITILISHIHLFTQHVIIMKFYAFAIQTNSFTCTYISIIRLYTVYQNVHIYTCTDSL